MPLNSAYSFNIFVFAESEIATMTPTHNIVIYVLTSRTTLYSGQKFTYVLDVIII